MTKKENAQPRNAELSARKNSADATTCKPFTPRQGRVIHALLQTSGWIARESIDRIAGASNGPEVIRQLRQRFGYGCIEMERIDAIDRDGFPTQPGRYRITDEGREHLANMGVQ